MSLTLSLRGRLSLVFVAATLIPLGATVWLTAQLLNQSLRLSPVNQLSDLSRSLEKTGKEYYQQAKDQLKADALAGRLSGRGVVEALGQSITHVRALLIPTNFYTDWVTPGYPYEKSPAN